jgi:uncharacterized membrane protein YcaP (DUF421 family)
MKQVKIMDEILIIILRTTLNYVLIYVTFRIMGKREIGELSLIDLIVFLMIAEIAALAIEETDEPYFYSVIAIGLLVFFERLIAYVTLKKTKIRDKLEGKPSVIIANGKVNYFEMRKNSYTFDDLLTQIRDKGFKSISEVEFAILETNGNLSTFKKEKGQPFMSPLPLVISGEIVKENFQYVDIDEMDFMTLLKNKGYNGVNKIMYANYENSELFIVSHVED